MSAKPAANKNTVADIEIQVERGKITVVVIYCLKVSFVDLFLKIDFSILTFFTSDYPMQPSMIRMYLIPSILQFVQERKANFVYIPSENSPISNGMVSVDKRLWSKWQDSPD